MKITIFTPTYNRCYAINKLYKSLCRQTCKDFEWIVIDDGSSDNTEELFTQLIKNNNGFNITYKKVENGGKHRAINKGIQLSKGELFFIVDSDDFLSDDAIERIIFWESTLDKATRWAGVAGLRANISKDNILIGTTFKEEFKDATSLQRQKYNINGDKAEVIYTDVIRKYPFKEFEGENFITENTMWYRVAGDGYKFRWFNEKIYYGEYLEDGLTNNLNSNALMNPQGQLEEAIIKIKYLKSLKAQLSAINKYYMIGKHFNKPKKTIAKELGVSTFKVNLSILAKKFFAKK